MTMTLHYNPVEDVSLACRRGPTFDFTRATEAMFVDWEGIIRTAQSGEARFTGARRVENEIIQSNDLSTGWTNSGSVDSQNYAADPFGGTAAQRLIDNSDAGAGFVFIRRILAMKGAFSTYTTSFYAKADQESWVRVSLNAIDALSYFAYFDLANGVVGVTGANNVDQGISDAGGGWYRCWITYDTTADVNPWQEFYVAEADNDVNFAIRDGSHSVLLYGVQVEKVAGQADTSPSEYQATTTAAVAQIYNSQKDGSAFATPVTGLLVEEARTQLAADTGDVSDDAVWVLTNMTKGSDSVEDPMGAANTNVRLTAAAGNATLLQTVTSAVDNYIYGVYMKRVTGTGDIDITLDDGVTWTTKVLTSEWTRFSVVDAEETNPVFGVRIVTSGDAIDFWGSDVNKDKTFLTSHIPNNADSGTVTRNVDLVKSTDVAWFNETEGTIYVDASNPYLQPAVSASLIDINDVSANNRHYVYRAAAHDGNYLTVSDGDLDVFLSGAATPYDQVNTSVKHAVCYKVNDHENYVDGDRTGTGDQLSAVPTGITTIDVGQNEQDGENFSGHIAEIRYYNVRKDNQFLEDLSNGLIAAVDLTGLPAGFFSVANCLKDADFRAQLRIEAEDAGVWAYWVPGVLVANDSLGVLPKRSANLKLNLALIRAEASDTATWARWAPGTQSGNSGNLQVDMITGLERGFALT